MSQISDTQSRALGAATLCDLATGYLSRLALSPHVPTDLSRELAREGGNWAAEFQRWDRVQPPDVLVRLERLNAFREWCTRVTAAIAAK